MSDWDEANQNLGMALGQQPKPTSSGASYWEMLGRSTVGSIPEVFGFRAPLEVQQWRADNPIAAFASEAVGMLVPYGGWAKAAGRIPTLGRMIEGANIVDRPVLSAFRKEMVRWAPFEGARIASAGIFGDMDTSEVALSAALDLGLIGGFGAGIAALRGAKPILTPETSLGQQVQKLVPDFDLTAPLQDRLKRIRELKDTMPEAAKLFDAADTELSRNIRLETVDRQYTKPTGPNEKPLASFVRSLEDKDADPGAINRLFKTNVDIPRVDKDGKPVLQSAYAKRFISNKGEFPDEASWRQAATELGLPSDFEHSGQYFRELGLRTDKRATAVGKTIESNLKSVGDNWYVGSEGPNGMMVMAKRTPFAVPAEVTSKFNAGDRWVIFKTDTPGRFVPHMENYKQAMNKRMAYDPFANLNEVEMQKKLGVELPDYADKLMTNIMPFRGWLGNPTTKGLIVAYDKTLQKMGIDKAVGDIGEGARNTIRGLKQYVAPRIAQFSHSPTARYIVTSAKIISDFAQSRAHNLMYGTAQLGKKQSLFKEILQSKGRTPGIASEIDALSDASRAEIMKAWANQTPPTEVVDEAARNFLTRISAIDTASAKEINGIAQLTGNQELKVLPNHYMISRTWIGDWRAPVFNEANKLVYMGAGRSPSAAEKAANNFIKTAGDSGVALRRADLKEMKLFQSGHEKDLEFAKRLQVSPKIKEIEALTRRQANAPGFFQKREDIGGYIGHENLMTKQEMKDIIWSHLERSQRYMAEMTVNHKLKPYMKMLQETQPELVTHVNKRLDDVFQKQGPVAKAINSAADKVLAPFIGSNSATRIAGEMNGLMAHWQLGLGNITHPITNALTFIQTVIPEAAFVLGTDPLITSKYYSMFPMVGSSGMVKNSIGVLDMLKLMRQSFREMGNPSDELFTMFHRAATEGHVDPKFIEQVMGQNSKMAGDLKTAFASPGGFANAVKAMSFFLPSASEKFSRGHAFTVGHIIGRDFFKLEGERLYRFAVDFNDRTMYQYTTADRPRFMAGPLGSTYGLFKNWSYHYVSNMMMYLDNGIKYNNWSPFLWSMAGSGAVAGAGGTPLYFAADAISRLYNNQSLMQNIYQQFGSDDPRSTSVADVMFYGLPAFLGTSLQASAGSPGSDITRDVSLLVGSVWLDRAKSMGKAVGNAFDYWSATGQSPFGNGAITDQLMRGFGPRSIYRAISVAQEGTLRSLQTGNVIAGDLKWNERLAYAMGVNPLMIEKTMTVSSELWADQAKMRNEVSRMGSAWADALKSGDDYTLTVLSQRAFANGIPLDSIIHSANKRLTNQAEPTLTRQFKNVDKRAQGILQP